MSFSVLEVWRELYDVVEPEQRFCSNKAKSFEFISAICGSNRSVFHRRSFPAAILAASRANYLVPWNFSFGIRIRSIDSRTRTGNCSSS